MFRYINGYPNWVIEQTIEKVKNQNEIARSIQVTTNNEENEHLLMLSYKGKVGETRLKPLRNTLKPVMPANNTHKIIYTGMRLVPKFNIKDKISKKADLNCDATYVGEIGRRFAEPVIEPLWS